MKKINNARIWFYKQNVLNNSNILKHHLDVAQVWREISQSDTKIIKILQTYNLLKERGMFPLLLEIVIRNSFCPAIVYLGRPQLLSEESLLYLYIASL